MKTKTKYRKKIKEKGERRKEIKKGSIKPGRVMITPELYQELINLHNSVHRVSDTPHFQALATPKIASIFDD